MLEQKEQIIRRNNIDLDDDSSEDEDYQTKSSINRESIQMVHDGKQKVDIDIDELTTASMFSLKPPSPPEIHNLKPDYNIARGTNIDNEIVEDRMTEAELSPAKHIVRQQTIANSSSVSRSGENTSVLDMAVECSPEEFYQEWSSLPPNDATILACKTDKIPLMKECHDHLESNRFFVIASGVIGEGIMKLFAIAQHEGTRCLMEIEFNPSTTQLVIQFRAHDTTHVPYFIRCLRLRYLFGDFVHELHAT